MRYTISYHNTEIGDHFDLFLENSGDSLYTYEFRTELFLNFLRGEEISASKKENHRLKYLDFEGDISDGRGFVKIVEKGEYWSQISENLKKICIQRKKFELFLRVCAEKN